MVRILGILVLCTALSMRMRINRFRARRGARLRSGGASGMCVGIWWGGCVGMGSARLGVLRRVEGRGFL